MGYKIENLIKDNRPVIDDDLIGKKFNRITLLNPIGYMNKNRLRIWKAVCDCGVEFLTAIKSVKKGASKSCGCLRVENGKTSMTNMRKDAPSLMMVKYGVPHPSQVPEFLDRIVSSGKKTQEKKKALPADHKKLHLNAKDHTGKKIGRLLFLEPVGRSNDRKVVWKFLCDCGRYSEIVAKSVLNGTTISCGCYQKEQASIRIVSALSKALEKLKQETGLTSFNQLPLVKEKTRNTNIARYGGPSCMSDESIYQRTLKNSNNCEYIEHWETKKLLICRASYEKAVVKYLNDSKIRFDWQIKYVLKSGRSYYVDLYLIEQDIWVEIKGRWHPEALKKWKEFIIEYPNSEVWDRKKLRGMGLKIQ